MTHLLILFSVILSFMVEGKIIALQDNLLFGFEKCRKLNVDLEKGLLKESIEESFDLHCKKSAKDELKFSCSYFKTGSNKEFKKINYVGGSDLGEAELVSDEGEILKFLVGKKFASYTRTKDLQACAGIFIFEKDALRKKASSLKSDLSN